jgi:hypothetical protein
MKFEIPNPAGARTATVLAGSGLFYIGYLFVLACLVLNRGIPKEEDYVLKRVPPEADILGVSSVCGFVPLLLVFIAITVLARSSHAPVESRLPYSLLVIGFPLAAVAYFTWYECGW